jgi:outer membrane immunogenic protein
MKFATLALTSVALMTCGVARAADFPVKAAPAPLPFSWTGFYVGINGGYENANFTADTGQSRTANGGFGGVQTGYNYQVASRWVVGAEVDAGLAALTGTFIRPDPLVPNVIIADQQKIDYDGSARLRAGIAFDRALFYGTGGFAWGHATETAANSGNGGPGAVASILSESHLQSGSVVGGGLEAILAGNWIARVEYLHTSLGAQTYTILPASVRINTDAVRVGLSYLFR